MSTTINRGTLLRMARRGELEVISSYHFDDPFGGETSKQVLPVRVRNGHNDTREGFCNLWESDFKSSCGRAYQNPDGTIHLSVHSNCFFDLRVKSGNVKPQSQPTFGTPEEFKTKVLAFADLVDVQTAMRLIREGYGNQIESHRVSVKFGKKYARVDVGDSGKYMIDVTDGTIYGIKGYGQVHKGHRYGTLDTIDQWRWGDYRAFRPHGVASLTTHV